MKKIIFFMIIMVSIATTSYTQNWDGDGSQGNFSWDNNWYGDTQPGWVSSSELSFIFRNNSSQTNLYYNYGSWKDCSNIIYQSTFGAGLELTGDGYGLNFYGKIENLSSYSQTINIPLSGKNSSKIEINPTNADIVMKNTVHNDANKNYEIYGNSGKKLYISGNLLGTGGLTIKQWSFLVLQSSLSYTGNTALDNGELWFDESGALNGGTIYVGNGGFLATYAKLWISDSDGGTTVNENIIVNPANAGTKYIGGLNASGTNTYSGTVTLDGPVNLEANQSGGTTEFSGIISGSSNVTKSGTGTIILTADNTYTGTTTVSEGTLQLEGSIASSSVTIQSGATLNIEGSSITVNSLTVESGGIVNISPNMGLTVSGNLPNSGTTITVNSDATGTGSLIVEGTPTGNVSVERYIGAWSDASHGWHLLSSPVGSQAIKPAFVPTTPTTSEDFYMWDETATSLPWINSESSSGVWNTNFDNNFLDGKGYLCAYESIQTKTFSGTPNYSDVSKPGLTYTTGNSHTGWHLLGNPYPSALYWNKNAGWSLTNIDATAKKWEESSASYTDIAAITGVIPAMQGFMAHVTSDATASLNIDATDRTHNTQDWYKETEINKIKLIAYDTEGSTAQESIIKVNENATAGFDSEFDSHFLAGYAPQFYSVLINEEIVSTNALPELTSSTTIPMSFIKNGSSTYYIEAEGINNLDPQETVYLTDLKTNNTQVLNDNPRYDFTSEEGDIAERFLIHFSPLSINNIQLSEQINVFSSNGNVEIRSNKPVDAEIFIYSISGQLITTSELNNESSTSLNVKDYKGAAIVSIVTSGQTLNEKVIIW